MTAELTLALFRLNALQRERAQAEAEIEENKAKLIVFDAQITALEAVAAEHTPPAAIPPVAPTGFPTTLP